MGSNVSLLTGPLLSLPSNQSELFPSIWKMMSTTLAELDEASGTHHSNANELDECARTNLPVDFSIRN